jgi:hypothetical protein
MVFAGAVVTEKVVETSKNHDGCDVVMRITPIPWGRRLASGLGGVRLIVVVGRRPVDPVLIGPLLS